MSTAISFCFYFHSRFLAVLCVISVVALLTQCPQIVGGAVLGRMVEVSNRKDYPCLFARLGIEPHSVVLYSAELASVVGAFKYGGAYLLPVFWVTVAVFGSYRHIILPL